MSFLRIPQRTLKNNLEAHRKWCNLVQTAQIVIEDDFELQNKAAKGLCLKERHLPPEVLGRMYGQYCSLINKMYDSYLNSVHLQRAPYMIPLISVLLKRLYELRQELVYLIVNDYIYIDVALQQLKMTPADIEIVVPYHFPLESRTESMEQLLQTMWANAVERNHPPSIVEEESVKKAFFFDDEEEYIEDVKEASIHTVSEECIQMNIIKKHERYRQWFLKDFKNKCEKRRTYFAQKVEDAPLETRNKAAQVIQKVYREFMKLKRMRLEDAKRDVLLGIIPDSHRQRLNFLEENNKIYEKRRLERERVMKIYVREKERENTRLILFRKEDQIDDITDQVRDWFREWYFGYGFFPEYPYEVEGGTVLVLRGEYPTIDEKIEADKKLAAETKGKTKEMLKQEKETAKFEAAIKAQQAREKAKKDAEALFKLKCNPYSDPGYTVKQSAAMKEIFDVFQKYQAAWSLYDHCADEYNADFVYGYMKSLITEELMNNIHLECRKYVDTLMRLDLKLLIKMHQLMYKRVGFTYPKFKPRKKPKAAPRPKTLKMDDNAMKNLNEIFDLDIITKPISKLKDIIGDSNYGAYELNIQDPDAKFPPPGYGDVKRRLLLSCIFGSGLAPGATRNRSVLLLGPPRSGKTFLVDCVAGEMNAVKIDITPEVFSAVSSKPGKAMSRVLLAAKVFQPAVIFMRNVERVFAKKVPPEDKYLNAKALKGPLTKMLKAIPIDAKIIFIATCSVPSSAVARPMTSIFSEMILVPLTDYGSVQMFFYHKLQRVYSIPRDYCVQALAQLLQGYGFGTILEAYNKVMQPARIVNLSIHPLSPAEFLEPIFEAGVEPLTIEDYKTEFVDFFITNSYLMRPRLEYTTMNTIRADMYKKMAKKMAVEKAKKEKVQKNQDEDD